MGNTTDVYVFTKKDCPWCERMKLLLPAMRQLVAESELGRAGVALHSVADDQPKVSSAVRGHVKGFPTIVFVLDGAVEPRYTVAGFPGKFKDLTAFVDWFARYLCCVHTRNV